MTEARGQNVIRFFLVALLVPSLFFASPLVLAKSTIKTPQLSAKSAVIVDPRNGGVLYSKNPHLRLPPASTTKVMTVLIAFEKLSLDKKITVSRSAVNVAPSKAGLTLNARYKVRDLIVATLVASSNDAAVALAEAVSGSEKAFVKLMNAKAKKLGMNNTKFLNSTGLPEKGRKQYSTAHDLARLMRQAAKDKRIDKIMGITWASIRGSDGRWISIKSHNKMLWRIPKFVKGKTGWTFASRHTFIGTNYEPHKKIIFAMLSSKEPWVDIERLATFGLRCLPK